MVATPPSHGKRCREKVFPYGAAVYNARHNQAPDGDGECRKNKD